MYKIRKLLVISSFTALTLLGACTERAQLTDSSHLANVAGQRSGVVHPGYYYAPAPAYNSRQIQAKQNENDSPAAKSPQAINPKYYQEDFYPMYYLE